MGSSLRRMLAMPPMLMLALLSPPLLSWAARGAAAEVVVTGTVFCDQCLDGQRDLFDYPLYGLPGWRDIVFGDHPPVLITALM